MLLFVLNCLLLVPFEMVYNYVAVKEQVNFNNERNSSMNVKRPPDWAAFM